MTSLVGTLTSRAVLVGSDKAVLHQQELRITETFFSLQGESSLSGLPTTFIRLTGCPLRCSYCDSEYAFHGGEKVRIEALAQICRDHGARHICVTGGEPLAQPNVHLLLERLCDLDYQVSLETSGALDISSVDQRVKIVMDVKTPSSKEESRNRLQNLAHLSAKDEIKFVIADREDFDFSVELTERYQQDYSAAHQAAVLFSPVHEDLEPAVLAEWMLKEKVAARFQIQLHKLLWGDKTGV